MPEPIHFPVRQYRDLEEGEYIIIFADPSEGGDFCAAACLSKKYLDYPIIYSDKIDSAQFGNELYGLAQWIYRQTSIWPHIAVERNTGAATIHVLRTLNYSNLFHMVDYAAPNFTPLGQHQGSVGWLTTGHRTGGEIKGTRRKMLDDLALAIKQDLLTIYDEEQLKQLISFRYVGDVGRQSGRKHDDHVITSAGSYEVHLVTPDVDLYDVPDEEALRNQRAKWRFR